jgi:hypothetical protein
MTEAVDKQNNSINLEKQMTLDSALSHIERAFGKSAIVKLKQNLVEKN